MYGRDYQNRTLNFEASGGLANSSLIMQDKQTDTYWSIMTGAAEAGALQGTRLIELPLSKKVSWRDWVAQHPDTLVLSVRGVQDPKAGPYGSYFADPRGFRGASAHDSRLATKDSIYAFLHRDQPYAVDSRRVAAGRSFQLKDGLAIFLYRDRRDEMFRGTAAFKSEAGFEQRDGVWIELGSGARFDPDRREFAGADVERLNGFDTFWYNWSLTHPNTKLLR